MIQDEVLNAARDMIAEFISNRRQELGLTQQELADKAGLGWATVQRIEAGKFMPDGKSLLKICYALDLRLSFENRDPNEPVIKKPRAVSD